MLSTVKLRNVKDRKVIAMLHFALPNSWLSQTDIGGVTSQFDGCVGGCAEALQGILGQRGDVAKSSQR